MTGLKSVMRGALLASLLFTGNAWAADLGGNCCADLEERVAELEATTAKKGGKKVTLTVSGHVNEALLMVDAPGLSKKTIINNTNDQSRVRFVGEAKFATGWSAGYLLELGTAVASTTGSPGYDVGVRHSAWFLENKDVGRVWVGKTSTATDGIAEIDVSNASIASTRLSLEALSGAYLGGSNLPYDGNREEVVKFVSPNMKGFTASAAWFVNKNDAWDVALRYAGELSGLRIGAGIGYRVENDGVTTADAKTIAGSVSVMHIETGLFANGSYGDLRGAAVSGFLLFNDIKAAHFQAGIERKVFDIGKTTGYVEWGRLKNDFASGDFYGLGAVQSIDGAAMDLYVGYRKYDKDLIDVQTFMAGGIIRF